MTEKPLVSIIIVNYNGRKHLEECLQSLKNVNNTNYEIILIDNNSTDDSVNFVNDNFPYVKLIKLDKNLGFAFPNNIATKSAIGDLFLFLNNDTYVDPNFMDELINTFETNPEIGICQSLLLKPNADIDSSGDFVDFIGVSYSSKESISKLREVLSAKGAALMIRRNVFEKLGGFDEKFFVSFEDVDLGWRSWISGYKVTVNPKSIVYHYGGITTKEMRSQLVFHGYKNQLIMILTNFEFFYALKNIFLFLITFGLREIKVWFDYKIKNETKITLNSHDNTISSIPNFTSFLKSIWWLTINLKYLWNKRKLVGSSRVNSTSDLLKKKLITKS